MPAARRDHRNSTSRKRSPQGRRRNFVTEKLERITDTLSVYQEKGVFCYGTDAVLLSAYTAGKLSKSRPLCGMELCSGTGFIALSLLDRFPLLSFSALEINEHAAALSQKSAAQRFMPSLSVTAVHRTHIILPPRRRTAPGRPMPCARLSGTPGSHRRM